MKEYSSKWIQRQQQIPKSSAHRVRHVCFSKKKPIVHPLLGPGSPQMLRSPLHHFQHRNKIG